MITEKRASEIRTGECIDHDTRHGVVRRISDWDAEHVTLTYSDVSTGEQNWTVSNDELIGIL